MWSAVNAMEGVVTAVIRLPSGRGKAVPMGGAGTLGFFSDTHVEAFRKFLQGDKSELVSMTSPGVVVIMEEHHKRAADKRKDYLDTRT